MTNYANWFAYYRTRILAAKTTTAIAFNIVDNTYRAGFHSMNLRNAGAPRWRSGSTSTTSTPAQRTAWYAQALRISIGTGMTPTHRRGVPHRRGRQAGRGGVTGLPAHTDPDSDDRPGNPGLVHEQLSHPVHRRRDEPARAADGRRRSGRVRPFRRASSTARCRPIQARRIPERTLAGRSSAVWPRVPAVARSVRTPHHHAPTRWPTSRSTTGCTDLRPTMTNDVPSHDGRAGKDLDWKHDPAWWQHVNFSAISFGSDGLLDSADVADEDRPDRRQAPRFWFTAPNYPAPPNKPASASPPRVRPPPSTTCGTPRSTAAARSCTRRRPSRSRTASARSSPASATTRRPASARPSPASRSERATNNFIYRGDDRAGLVRRAEEGHDRHVHRRAGRDRAGRPATKLDALLATPALGTSPGARFRQHVVPQPAHRDQEHVDRHTSCRSCTRSSPGAAAHDACDDRDRSSRR